MTKRVERSIEKILDQSGRRRTFQVLVQLKSPSEDLQHIYDAASESAVQRQMATSARELAPPMASVMKKRSQPTAADKRHLRKHQESMSSQLVISGIKSKTLNMLRKQNTRVVNALYSNAHVSRSIAETVEKASRRKSGKGRGKKKEHGYRTFWSSRSALLSFGRDDLAKLPRELENIVAVALNERVSLPPIVEVRRQSNSSDDPNANEWGLERIGALAAWGSYGVKGAPRNAAGKPVKVAILDTGVDASHPELTGKLVDWAEFDTNGDEISNSRPHDSGKHGTHVCGTIAGSRTEAPSKDYPWIGVAPEAELAVGLVLNRGSGSYAQILAGIDWAVLTGADIINMSLGGVSFEPDVDDFFSSAIISANQLGVPVVVSIGNEGAQTTGAPGNDYFAFSVGATDDRDNAGGFSGGRTQVIRQSDFLDNNALPLIYSKPEVSAPGISVRSSTPNGKYETWNGTSMAAPHVSGALALLLAATDIRNVPQERRAYLLQDLLISSVDELGETGRDHRYGFGRINVLRAISLARDLGY